MLCILLGTVLRVEWGYMKWEMGKQNLWQVLNQVISTNHSNKDFSVSVTYIHRYVINASMVYLL